MKPEAASAARARLSAGPSRLRRLLDAPLLLAAVLIAALPACTTGRNGEAREAPNVRAIPLGGDELASAVRLDERAKLGGGWRLVSEDPRFGGFSGLLVEEDRFVLLSDRGWLWQAERDPSRAPPFRSEWWRVDAMLVDGRAPDAEDLARTADGTVVAVVEGRHAVVDLRVDDPRSLRRLEPRALPEPLASLPGNVGVESLAALPGGALLAIAESGADGRHLAALLDGRAPLVLAYRSAPGFAPTGADWRDGWLYVVERRFSVVSGFSVRVTATAIRDRADLGDLLEPTVEIARFDGPGGVDNMEAIAAEPAASDGGVRLWLVSDDNYNRLQQTLMIAVDWSPQTAARASSRRFSRTSSDGRSASETERR